MPKINGRIDKINQDNLRIISPIQFYIKKVNGNKHGVLNISFKNAVFNELGYLTHDTSIPIGDI